MNNPFALAASTVTVYPKQKAWSFSTVNNHKTCPKKIKFAKIDRVPEPPNAAMERGTQIHKACAARIDHGVDQQLVRPDWLAKLDELRQRGAKSEVQLAFTREWEKCEWFGAHVWGRVVIDAHYLMLPKIVQIVEFKTGKVYPDHSTQLRLYALAGFLLYPDAEEARAENWYLDGPPLPHAGYVAQRSALPRLKEEFTEFSRAMLNDELYPATPGPHCRWCGFAKSKGSVCDFG
jgi:CRISPR/Cas system-associated exonuclease Cas4 (RecB family)